MATGEKFQQVRDEQAFGTAVAIAAIRIEKYYKQGLITRQDATHRLSFFFDALDIVELFERWDNANKS